MKEMMANVYWWAIIHEWEVMEIGIDLLTTISTEEVLFVLVVKAVYMFLVTK